MVALLMRLKLSILLIIWNHGLSSNALSVSRGVCQGGVLSLILFTLYINNLLKELSHSNVGCHWENIFVGVLAYANDLTLLAPTVLLLLGNSLPYVKKSGSELRFNKTQYIRFSRERLRGHGIAFQFCAKYIRCVEYVSHLGHIISYDLQNDLDIQSASMILLGMPTVYCQVLVFVLLKF